MHHHNNIQGLGKHKKVLITEKKIKLLLWVGAAMRCIKKTDHQQKLNSTFFRPVNTQKTVGALLCCLYPN